MRMRMKLISDNWRGSERVTVCEERFSGDVFRMVSGPGSSGVPIILCNLSRPGKEGTKEDLVEAALAMDEARRLRDFA